MNYQVFKFIFFVAMETLKTRNEKTANKDERGEHNYLVIVNL